MDKEETMQRLAEIRDALRQIALQSGASFGSLVRFTIGIAIEENDTRIYDANLKIIARDPKQGK
jgi:hypothetical protein